MARDEFVRVWQNSGRPGRCKQANCQRRLSWVITDRGKRLPMNAGAIPIRTERDERNGGRFEVFAMADCHWRTCKDPPPRRSRPRVGDVQPRLL